MYRCVTVGLLHYCNKFSQQPCNLGIIVGRRCAYTYTHKLIRRHVQQTLPIAFGNSKVNWQNEERDGLCIR